MVMFDLPLGSIHASQHYCPLARHRAHNLAPILNYELNRFHSINQNGHKTMGLRVLRRHDTLS